MILFSLKRGTIRDLSHDSMVHLYPIHPLVHFIKTHGVIWLMYLFVLHCLYMKRGKCHGK